MTAVDVHKPGADLGNRVVIIGGNLTGCETALYIKNLGKDVTIVEMTDNLFSDASRILGRSVQWHLDHDHGGVHCIADAECTEISDQGVHVKSKDGSTEIIPADSIILAVGMESTSETVESMLDCALDVIPIGDCVRPGTVREASRTGYYTALDI